MLDRPWPYHTFSMEKVEGDMEYVVVVEADGLFEDVFHRVYEHHIACSQYISCG